jgi:hypothetical protein
METEIVRETLLGQSGSPGRVSALLLVTWRRERMCVLSQV